MYNIRYTELAEADLSELFKVIYEDKLTIAVEYVDKLDSFIGLLVENLLMGIECKHKKIDRECRVLVYKSYLIFYRVTEDEVVIIRVLNAHIDFGGIIH